MDLDIDHPKFPLVMRDIELDSMYLLIEVHSTINEIDYFLLKKKKGKKKPLNLMKLLNLIVHKHREQKI